MSKGKGKRGIARAQEAQGRVVSQMRGIINIVDKAGCLFGGHGETGT